LQSKRKPRSSIEYAIRSQLEVFDYRTDWHVPIACKAGLDAFRQVRKIVLYLPSLCRAVVAKVVQMRHDLKPADLHSFRSPGHWTRRTCWCSNHGEGRSWKYFQFRDPHFSSRFSHLLSLLTALLDNRDRAVLTFVGFAGDENSRA